MSGTRPYCVTHQVGFLKLVDGRTGLVFLMRLRDYVNFSDNREGPGI